MKEPVKHCMPFILLELTQFYGLNFSSLSQELG